MSNKQLSTQSSLGRRMVPLGRCLVTLALVYVIGLTPPVLAFDTNIHPSVTRSALALYTNTNTLATLAESSKIGDTGLALVQSAPHFDNSQWVDGVAWISEHRQKAVVAAYQYYVTGSSSARQEVFDNLGYVLHAAQDFYAHSNWIETHDWGVIASLTGAPPNGWYSGKFPGAGEGSHNAMNKDDSTRTGYSRAYAAAVLATQEQIKLFKEALIRYSPNYAILSKLGFRGIDPYTQTLKVRYIDSALSWPNGKVYFFKGTNYIRYDWNLDRADAGYPWPIAGNWSGVDGSRGIDAAFVAPNNKTYLFQGSSFYRYDINADRVDDGYPVSISGNWPGLWNSGINAAVLWPNGKIYFFKGKQYIRYDWNNDCADPGYPRNIIGNWPGLEPFADFDIDAVEVTPDQKKAYFFCGDYYIRYDIEKDCADADYPRRIADNWPGL